jgi:hypothetical protein
MDLSEVMRLEEEQMTPVKRLARLLREAIRMCVPQGRNRYSRKRTPDGTRQYCAIGAAYLVAHRLPPETVLSELDAEDWARAQFGSALHDYVVARNDTDGWTYERIAEGLESPRWT